MSHGSLFMFAGALLWSGVAAAQTTVSLAPFKDNSIFEESGDLSNGADAGLFVGTELSGNERRALLAFDVDAIPVGATIQSVSLEMVMDRTIAGGVRISVHALDADWGEAGSDGASGGGGGAPAQVGDATWSHRFYPSDSWTSAGGDFDNTELAATTVSGTGPYSFVGGADFVATVQAWVDGAANHGLILLADPGAGDPSAKRFVSRDGLPANRPQLTISYTESQGGTFPINQGMSGGWYDLSTPGQGFLIDVDASNNFMFIAWFTYEEASVKVGSADQRWLTAQGSFDGAVAELDIFLTRGGVFDDPQAVVPPANVGTLSVAFDDCLTGTVSYDLPGDGLQGTVPIQRLIPGTEALCESLAAAR